MIAKNTSTASSTLPDFSRSPTIDQVGIEERVARLQKRSIKKDSKVHALKLALRNTGISEFHFNERGIHCVSFNAVPHLDRPDRPDAITYA